jgi:hypothetical protein
MRILEGVGTLIQLAGLAARLCKIVCETAIVLCIGRSYFDQELEAGGLMRAGGGIEIYKYISCNHLSNSKPGTALRRWQLKRHL